MRYAEQKQLVSDLRALADFYENPEAVELPLPLIQHHDYINTGGKWNSETQEYDYDVEKVNRKMKAILRALKACSPTSIVHKDYDDIALRLHVNVGKRAKVTVCATRNSVCMRVQVGTKIQKEYYSPSKEVPVYEYECEPSLLSVD